MTPLDVENAAHIALHGDDLEQRAHAVERLRLAALGEEIATRALERCLRQLEKRDLKVEVAE